MRNKGFSLIELMIVVAIVGILAALAYPSYRQHVIDSNRGQAASCLKQLAQSIERAHTENMSYNVDLDGDDGAEGDDEEPDDIVGCATEVDEYDFNIDTLTDQTYVLEADPQGNQRAADAGGGDRLNCGTLTLDETGDQGINGGGEADQCWGNT